MPDIGQTAGTVGSIIGMGIGLSLLAKTAKNVSDTMRPGYGRKDGSQRGFRSGGRGRNRTSSCRHPKTRSIRRKKSIRSRHTLKPRRSRSTGSLNMNNIYKW